MACAKKEEKLPVANVKNHSVEFQEKLVEGARAVRSVELRDFWSNEVIGRIEFIQGKISYFDTGGGLWSGVKSISEHNPSLIIDGKKLATDISEYMQQDLKSDEVQWLLYQIEAKEGKPRRIPFVLSIGA